MNRDNIDNQRTSRDKNIVSIVLGFFCVIVFFIFVSRLYSLQIIHGSRYKIQSKNISSRRTIIPAQRGEIYDRNNLNAMVINSDSFSVEVIPGEIPFEMYDTVSTRLSNILEISKTEIDEIITPDIRKNWTPVTVKTNVSFLTISNIAENISDLPGVSWTSKPMRNYIETGSFSHILGTVGVITKEELNLLYNKGAYNKKSIIGKSGIERQYDLELQGKEGYEERRVDVKGRLLSETPTIVPPQMGKKLVLTIDAKTQTLAEKALGKRIGSLIVLKPATGEILAMVSYPFYDSNYINFEKKDTEIENKDHPFLNRAVNAQYPPASTFKIIMSAAILAENAFPEYEKVDCKGEFDFGGRSWHCWILKPGHGKLDLKHAINQSCDIYFWEVGRDYLGIEKIGDYAKMFGYGQSTQIDLPPQSVSKGFVPSPVWKERKKHERWLEGDTMNVSIGQGFISATPLQVADVMAMVCNEGKIYKPHLLKEIRDPVTDDVIKEVQPEILFENSIDSAVWKKLKDALRSVCTEGTAKFSLANPTVKIAAKTGTAEVDGYKDRYHSWLLAFAPYDAPVEDQIVVCTMVEAKNSFESWSNYATNIVMQGYFANQSFDEAVDALNFRWLVNRANQRNETESQ